MNIKHKEGVRHSSFYIEENGKTVAEIVYSKSGEKRIVIEHTEVDEALQGKNIGYELVHKVVEYARENHLKITPVCSFAKGVFARKPDWADVL